MKGVIAIVILVPNGKFIKLNESLAKWLSSKGKIVECCSSIINMSQATNKSFKKWNLLLAYRITGYATGGYSWNGLIIIIIIITITIVQGSLEPVLLNL